MFTINLEDEREAPSKASILKNKNKKKHDIRHLQQSYLIHIINFGLEKGEQNKGQKGR
jgi:hypothetical protein